MSTAVSVCPRCSAPLPPRQGKSPVKCVRCGTRFPHSGRTRDVPIGRPVVPPSLQTTDKVIGRPAGPVSATSTNPGGTLSRGQRAMVLILSTAFVILIVAGSLILALAIPRRTPRENPAPGPFALSDHQGAVAADKPRIPVIPGNHISGNGGPAAGSFPNPSVPPVVLPEEDQQKVNQAIDKGVIFLKEEFRNKQMVHRPAVVPFIGLTLLECGVSREDPIVQKIVQRVRQEIGQTTETYHLSLAILFLDRLGRQEDRVWIQKLAARLMAGQDASGGWTYNCPHLPEPQDQQLLTFLASHYSPFLAQIGSGQGEDTLLGRGGPGSDTGFRGPEGEFQPGRTLPSGEKVGGLLGRWGTDFRTVKPLSKEELPLRLRNLAVVQYEPGRRLEFHFGSDNSNSQFAILGVWAARRHSVPVGQSLALIGARFRASQNADGSWGYHPHSSERRDSMTCAGLLGLAVGRVDLAARGQETQADPAIEKGLQFLGRKIAPAEEDQGHGSQRHRPIKADAMGGLYWLWSVERVGMIFNLKTIAGKDWYGWGARRIVDIQKEEGNWHEYHGPIPDTCFALLFLKRVNVAQDLTQQLQLLGPIRDPGMTPGKPNQ